MAIVRIDSTRSTNSAMQENAQAYGHGDVLVCREQTAGRGQRGNSWEAEPGKNLTFSLMLCPRAIPPSRAFVVSMAVSVGIVRALRHLTGLPVLLKWPNDIYVGDSKLAGILIENSFSGTEIASSVVGVGLNVNQNIFTSDAPNPVSLCQLCGRDFDLFPLLEEITAAAVEETDRYDKADSDYSPLLADYTSLLWRGRGEWPWLDVATGQQFRAAIESVALNGHITMATCPPRTYAFKEMAAVL